MSSAEARVERLFEGLSRHEVPIWAGVERSVPEPRLRAARTAARAQARACGREVLLDDAVERVRRAYALHLGDEGYWTGLFAVPVPASPRDRATSQLIVEDLVRALVLEDVLPEAVGHSLRADGEDLLGSMRGADGPGSEDAGEPPRDPFGPPLVATTLVGGAFLALAWSPEVAVLLALAAVIVLITRRLSR
jgi:hypothetical protein